MTPKAEAMRMYAEGILDEYALQQELETIQEWENIQRYGMATAPQEQE